MSTLRGKTPVKSIKAIQLTARRTSRDTAANTDDVFCARKSSGTCTGSDADTVMQPHNDVHMQLNVEFVTICTARVSTPKTRSV